MQYSKIREYNISKLTLGTVALGMDYGISNKYGKPGIKEGFKILDTAINAGINTVDTARIYGTAEQLVGDYINLQGNQRQVNIVSKFKIKPENLFEKDKARAEVFDSVQTSLQSLNLNQIPICLFHMDRELPVPRVLEILPAILEDLKHNNLIDLGGISVDHPSEVPFFVDHPLIEAIQVPVNLFDHRVVNNGMLQQLQAQNKIVFARSIFLQGLFFLSPDELKGNLVKAADHIRNLQLLANKEKVSIAQLAFSFVRDMEGVTSIIFGAENESQVNQNISLLQNKPMSPETRASIKALFNTMPEDIITPRYWSF